MSLVVILQLLYALVGAIYNTVSIVRVRLGRAPLSATNPVKGMAIMALVAGVSLSQPYFHGVIYIIGWLALAVFIGGGPVAAHYKAISRRQNLHLYSSLTAAYLAFSINAVGVALGCLGIVLTLADW